MMFFKLIRYDLRIGIIQAYKKYLVITAMFIILCVEFFLKYKSYSAIYSIETSFTVGDIALFCFAGMERYIPSPLDPFQFPTRWMLIHVALFYTVLHYPYNDLTEFGQNILIRSGGRSLWWLSKCVWCTISTAVFYLTAFLVVLIFGIGTSASFSLHISEYMPNMLGLGKNLAPQYDQLYPAIFILPVIVSMTLSLLQTSLSLLVKPLYSFGLMVTFMLASVYYFSPFMIGGYAIPVRSNKMVLNGMDFWTGLFISALVILLSIFLGLILFNKRDIFKGE